MRQCELNCRRIWESVGEEGGKIAVVLSTQVGAPFQGAGWPDF